MRKIDKNAKAPQHRETGRYSIKQRGKRLDVKRKSSRIKGASRGALVVRSLFRYEKRALWRSSIIMVGGKSKQDVVKEITEAGGQAGPFSAMFSDYKGRSGGCS